MDFKRRNVRFYGLMALLAMLLSASVIGCCCLHGKGQTQNVSICLCEKGVRSDSDTPVWPKGKFWGMVKNTAGQGPLGPQMKFQGPQNHTCNRYPNGGYMTIDLLPGPYTITVTASGYQTYVDQNVNLPEGGRIQKNFTMQSQMMQLQGTQAESVASLEDDNVSTPELQEIVIQMLGDIKGQILSLDPAVFKTPEVIPPTFDSRRKSGRPGLPAGASKDPSVVA